MVNSMEKEFLLLLWETKGKEFGMKEKELDGLMKMKPIPKSEYYYNYQSSNSKLRLALKIKIKRI